MSTLRSLVDAFVESINSRPREPERTDEVPAFLRENVAKDSSSGVTEGWTGWRIVRRDNSTRIDELQKVLSQPSNSSR